MELPKFKVESGIQLLTRLSSKKAKTEDFYQVLFANGCKSNEVIEICSSGNATILLIDMICEAILPVGVGGSEAGVLLVNTDGFITLQHLTTMLENKIKLKLNAKDIVNYTPMLQNAKRNLYVIDVYDAHQLYMTFLNMETLLLKHRNISFIIIDTITAFYWSEQNLKLTKMDNYLKNLLRIIQTAVKGKEVVLIYTRPEYFSSKDSMENLEACSEHPTTECINYKIKLLFNNEGANTVDFQTFQTQFIKSFVLKSGQICWL